MPDAVPMQKGSSRSLLEFALLALAVAALLIRCAAIAEPLGIDQGLWASAVRGMDRGQLLYRDVWEQRPPGIYFIYLAGFRVLGWTAATVAWLDILAAAAMTWLLYVIARGLTARVTAAAAACLYAVLTVPSWLYGYGGFLERSVCETFIVVCVAGAAWGAVRYRERRSVAAAFLIGLLCGGAVVLKPNAGLYYPAILLWIACYRRRESISLERRPLLASIAGTVVVPALTVLWLWKLGLLGDAKVAVLDFNRFYVSEGLSPAQYAVDFSKAVFLRMKTDPLWLAGGIGSLAVLGSMARRRALPPLAGLAVIWGAAAALVIVVNGARLFNSYFINALPPLSLLGAYLLGEFPRGSRVRAVVAVVTAVLMGTVLLQRGYPSRVYMRTAEDIRVLRGTTERLRYLENFGGYNTGRGYSARANEELADYIRAHTAPDDSIFLFGINGAGVYFDADRLAAHRFLRVNFFVATEFPNPDFRLDAVTRALAERRPRYLVFERLHRSSVPVMAQTVDQLPQDPLVATLLARYRLETRIEDFTLYRLID